MSTKHQLQHQGRVTVPEPAEPARLRLSGDADSDLVRARGDEGYTLAFISILLLPLMVFVALAVDLGAWYAQSSRMQRASDAASMAGVVWLPDQAQAQTAALAAAKANGYVTAGTTSITTSIPAVNQYQVSISANAPRFFSQIFEHYAVNMNRSAIAQFNKQIPMGSPANKFGNDLDNTTTPLNCPQKQPSTVAPCGPQPMLWAAINGPYDDKNNGDPYSTKCTNGHTGVATGDTTCDTGPANPEYRTTGYTYAIDVPANQVGTPLTVWSYDLPNYPRSLTANNVTVPVAGATADCQRGTNPFNTTAYYDTSKPTPSMYWNPSFSGGNCQTGDDGGTPKPGGGNYASGQNMDVQLWDNDGSDLTVLLTTKLACNQFTDLNAATATYKNTWAQVCTFTPTKSGIYPLRVRNSGFMGDPSQTGGAVADYGNGTNAYALKVTGSATTRIYALNDMSVFTNAPGSQSRFYLAEIPPENKGKKIQIDLYDPGDGNGVGPYTLQVLAPSAGAPNPVPTGGTVIPDAAGNVATSCKYNSTPSPSKGPATPTTATNCSVITRTAAPANVYNGNWLRFEIQISPNYNCGTVAIPDCWWTLSYTFGGSTGFPTDRTVWSLNVIGDPVHLVQ